MRGCILAPLTVIGGIGQRPVSAANLLLECSAGAPKRLRLFPEQPERGTLKKISVFWEATTEKLDFTDFFKVRKRGC